MDFPETGGSALPGAEREVDYNEPLQSANTTETVDDDSGASGGTTQGTVEGSLNLEATVGLADGHMATQLHSLCPTCPLCVLTVTDATKSRTWPADSSTAASVASGRTQ